MRDYLPRPETDIALAESFIDISADSSSDRDGVWLAYVGEFSNKPLTKDTDKLASIASIAATIQRMFKWLPNAYLAGIWKHSYLWDLLCLADGHSVKIATYVAPSWSWASVRGSFDFPSSSLDREGFRTSVVVRILETSVACVGAALGPVSQGILKLQGCLSRIRLSESELRDPRHPRFSKVQVGAVVLVDAWQEVRLDDDS